MSTVTQSSDRQRAPWFRIGPDLNMRVSDAERAEVADLLARHFGDGRLDQAEFDERVSRAMTAKTVGDLQGLFDDLPGDNLNSFPGAAKAPGTPPPAAEYAARRRRGPLRRPVRMLLTFVLVLVAANIVWHAVLGWSSPFVMLAAIVVAIALVARRVRRGCN